MLTSSGFHKLTDPHNRHIAYYTSGSIAAVCYGLEQHTKLRIERPPDNSQGSKKQLQQNSHPEVPVYRVYAAGATVANPEIYGYIRKPAIRLRVNFAGFARRDISGRMLNFTEGKHFNHANVRKHHNPLSKKPEHTAYL